MSAEKPYVREMIKNAVENISPYVTHKKIINWINEKYDDVNENTIRGQTSACTVNSRSRVGYPECSKPREYDERYDFLFTPKTGSGIVEFYKPAKHGKWTIMKNNNGKITIAKDGVPLSDGSKPSLLKFLKDDPTMFQNYQAIVIKTLLENETIEKTDYSQEGTDEEYLNFLLEKIKSVSRKSHYEYQLMGRENLIQ